MQLIELDSFTSYTLGIIVFFIGFILTQKVKLLREFNIPEPVTGGLFIAFVFYLIFVFFDLQVSFDLSTRDTLLVYFFTAIGLNASFKDLSEGGKPLLILLALTLSYIVVQDAIGVLGAMALKLPSQLGVLTGSTALIGGHGTAIAWAADIEDMGVNNALEIGIAAATIGLVIASLLGGPIAKYLINKYKLTSDQQHAPVIGIGYNNNEQTQVNHINLMSTILVLHICILFGWFCHQIVLSLEFKLPLFVTCLIVAIVFSNTIPKVMPKLKWPARTKALALVSDFSLSLFLSMSLMSMQLWTIAALAGPLLILLLLQTIGAVLFILLVLFPLMGRNYQAAVLSSGFAGFALGATPTAIANMTAVTKVHGPAPTAFIILPLVAAFFVDVTNAFVIKFALSL